MIFRYSIIIELFPVLSVFVFGKAAVKAQLEAKQLKSRNSDLRRPARIVVTQPRRIAAITVAKRVAEELGEKATHVFS